MRFNLSLSVLLVLGLISMSDAAESTTQPAVKDALSQFEPRTLQSDAVAGGTLNYRLFTPQGYDAKAETSYPLMLFLHGAGERGTDNKAQLKWGGAELVKDLQAAGRCFVIAPQCPPNKQWVNTPWAKGNYSTAAVAVSDELKMAIEAVEKVSNEFKIDKSRIYVMGLSMGGFGTWDAIARRPDLFAAAVPICGGGDPAVADKLKKLSIWAFHGGADNVVPVKGTQEMVAALKKSGSAEPNLKYTEFPGVGHNSWSPAWETEGLFEWILAQKK